MRNVGQMPTVHSSGLKHALRPDAPCSTITKNDESGNGDDQELGVAVGKLKLVIEDQTLPWIVRQEARLQYSPNKTALFGNALTQIFQPLCQPFEY